MAGTMAVGVDAILSNTTMPLNKTKVRAHKAAQAARDGPETGLLALGAACRRKWAGHKAEALVCRSLGAQHAPPRPSILSTAAGRAPARVSPAVAGLG